MQDHATALAVQDMSYNKAAEYVARCEDTDREFRSPNEALTTLHRGEVIAQFLASTAGQLTYHGLTELLRVMQVREHKIARLK